MEKERPRFSSEVPAQVLWLEQSFSPTFSPALDSKVSKEKDLWSPTERRKGCLMFSPQDPKQRITVCNHSINWAKEMAKRVFFFGGGGEGRKGSHIQALGLHTEPPLKFTCTDTTLVQKHTMTWVTCACPPIQDKEPGIRRHRLNSGRRARTNCRKAHEHRSWFLTKASRAGSQPTLPLSPTILEMELLSHITESSKARPVPTENPVAWPNRAAFWKSFAKLYASCRPDSRH